MLYVFDKIRAILFFKNENKISKIIVGLIFIFIFFAADHFKLRKD